MNKIVIFFLAVTMLFAISCKDTVCDTDIQTALNEQCIKAGHARGHISHVFIYGNLYYCVREDASLIYTAEPIASCK